MLFITAEENIKCTSAILWYSIYLQTLKHLYVIFKHGGGGGAKRLISITCSLLHVLRIITKYENNFSHLTSH